MSSRPAFRAAILATTLLAASLSGLATSAAAEPGPPPTSQAGGGRSATASGNSVLVSGGDAQAGDDGDDDPSVRNVTSGGVPMVKYQRAEACGVLSAGVGSAWPCDEVRDHTDVCGDAPVLLPLWRSDRVSADENLWGPWPMVQDLSCAAPALPTPGMVLAEFRRLPLTPSTLHLQPDRGWVLVNVDTIAYTDPAPQTLVTTILGVSVTIHATPASYTWDFGEDTFSTTSPGHRYPDQDVAHPYEQPGTAHVELSTAWQATYTVGTDPTVRDVPGTAVTTSTSPQFEIHEAAARLVRGTCDEYPDDPGC